MVDCPLIDPDLKKVSLSAIEDLSQNHLRHTMHGAQLKPGTVIRHIGRYNDVEDAESEPVTFLATQHLTLHDNSHVVGLDDNQHVLTLRQSLYDFDGPIGNDSRLWPKDQVLHVSQCWCLVVGSGIIWYLF